MAVFWPLVDKFCVLVDVSARVLVYGLSLCYQTTTGGSPINNNIMVKNWKNTTWTRSNQLQVNGRPSKAMLNKFISARARNCGHRLNDWADDLCNGDKIHLASLLRECDSNMTKPMVVNYIFDNWLV